MRPYRTRFREQGVFFAFQSWAGCITNMFGFDLRQAHVSRTKRDAAGRNRDPMGQADAVSRHLHEGWPVSHARWSPSSMATLSPAQHGGHQDHAQARSGMFIPTDMTTGATKAAFERIAGPMLQQPARRTSSEQLVNCGLDSLLTQSPRCVRMAVLVTPVIIAVGVHPDLACMKSRGRWRQLWAMTK